MKSNCTSYSSCMRVSMTHRLATNYAKNYRNRTLIVKVIVENAVTCFLGHGVEQLPDRNCKQTCTDKIQDDKK